MIRVQVTGDKNVQEEEVETAVGVGARTMG
jgi:hypothetical protein